MSGDPDRLMTFLQDAFYAEQTHLTRRGDGKILHAQMRVVDSILMIGGAGSRWPAEASSLYLYLEDVDRVFASAVAAGTQVIMPSGDQIYGDWMGGVKDPTGITWWLIEDVTPDQMRQRMKGRAAAGGAGVAASDTLSPCTRG